MVLETLSIVCAGLFAGAAIYITAVEHPARLACGPAIAIKQFAPSYHRATVMQASLAMVGCATGITAWVRSGNPWLLGGALLLGSVVPFTLLVILPTNQQLLDPARNAEAPETSLLLARWGQLHAVRSVLGAGAFGLLLRGLVAG